MKVLAIGKTDIIDIDSKILVQTCLLPCDGNNPIPQKYIFQSHIHSALLKGMGLSSPEEDAIRAFRVGDFPKGEVFKDVSLDVNCERIPFIVTNPLVEEYICEMEKKIQDLQLQVSNLSFYMLQKKPETNTTAKELSKLDNKGFKRFTSFFKRRK